MLLHVFAIIYYRCSIGQEHVRSFTVSDYFFFNDTATTEIYTLSLHDALPILPSLPWIKLWQRRNAVRSISGSARRARSEEHTSELQSHSELVCRLLLEKKK